MVKTAKKYIQKILDNSSWLVDFLIAILLVGPSIIESFSIYWWEAVFLYTLIIGLLFLYDYVQKKLQETSRIYILSK